MKPVDKLFEKSGDITKMISKNHGVGLQCKAMDFIQDLPNSGLLYPNGPIIYPPRGQGDIATIAAAFAHSVLKEKQVKR